MSTYAIDHGPVDPDGDLLDRLGFTPGDPDDGPLIIWPGPAVRPTLRRTPRERSRPLRPRAA